jgi:hypothetical protein
VRKKLVLGLSLLFLLIGVNPANAMGYILWSAESGKTTDFSQEISINSAHTYTAWKAQVRISSDLLFGIAVVQRESGAFEAEFGTYFNQGVQPIPSPRAACAFSAANSFQQNFSNCKISIQVSLPARIRFTINRDPLDPTGRTWVGNYSNVTTGEEYLISKFDVGQANLNILDIYEYAYPFGINECQVTPSIQESIWWQPTSTNGKFNFSSTNRSNCGTVSFVTPQSYMSSDGVLIQLNTLKSESRTYRDSIYEVLNPEVWKTAYSSATKSAKADIDKTYSALQISSEKTIGQLQSQISEMNLSIKKLQNQVKKICSARKKPLGC